MRNAAIALAKGIFGSARRAFRPEVGGLEARLMLSTTAPDVSLVSVTTSDSRSVLVSYNVNTPKTSLDLGVYRSADRIFDASDRAIASVHLDASQKDDNGQSALAAGSHTKTATIPDGITVEPGRPYVLVVASPSTAIGSTRAIAQTGVLHMRTIAVVTHGGIQSRADDETGPLWQNLMAKELKAQGYDAVVKFVWASDSRTPGRAAEQAPKLARILNKMADKGGSTDPISIHFIGHSEGTVINSRAAQLLQTKQSPSIAHGFLKMTMLDPHSANNSAPGSQYSVDKGLLGQVAKWTIRTFQTNAKDPLATIPKNIDDSEVFWQHTPVEFANTNSGIYNLWGQTPVSGNTKSYDLTGLGISHGGDFGVQNWYRANVIPALGAGGQFVDPTTLTGSVATTSSATSRPTFTGTAAPGATVTLLAAASGSFGWKPVGTASTDPTTGAWSITTRDLRDGRYRFAVRSVVPAFKGHPGPAVTPRLRLGSLKIDT